MAKNLFSYSALMKLIICHVGHGAGITNEHMTLSVLLLMHNGLISIKIVSNHLRSDSSILIFYD